MKVSQRNKDQEVSGQKLQVSRLEYTVLQNHWLEMDVYVQDVQR